MVQYVLDCVKIHVEHLGESYCSDFDVATKDKSGGNGHHRLYEAGTGAQE